MTTNIFRNLANRRARRFLCFLAILTITASLRAQEPPAIYLPNNNQWYDANDARSVDSIRDRHRTLIESFEWVQLFSSLCRGIAQGSEDWSDYADSARQYFLTECSLLVSQFKRATKAARLNAKDSVAAILSTVQTDRFSEGIDAQGNLAFFAGRETEIVPLTTGPRGEPLFQLSREQIENIRYRARAINSILKQDVLGTAYLDAVMAMERAEVRWQNYLQDGVSQYPWEVLFNGLLSSPGIQYPPRYQLLLFHPEISVEFSTHSFDNFVPEEAMTIDIIGLTYYTSDDFSHFWGISTITSHRSDLGLGIGARLRFGASVNAGIIWHDIDDDGNYFDASPYAVLSLDFFQLLKSRADKLREVRDEIRSKATLLEGLHLR